MTEDRTENIKGDRTEDRTGDRAENRTEDRTEETHTTGQKTGQDRRYITIPLYHTTIPPHHNTTIPPQHHNTNNITL